MNIPAAAAVVYGYASNPAYWPGYGAAAAAATAFCFEYKKQTCYFSEFYIIFEKKYWKNRRESE